MDVKEIKTIKKEALDELEKANSIEELGDWEVHFLGRKQGKLTMVLRGLSELPSEQRREVGRIANQAREELEKVLRKKKQKLTRREEKEKLKTIDVTLPGLSLDTGALHPITKVQRELQEIFSKLGFITVEGPELETDFYNFEALNIPKGHPARDLMDTFYVKSGGDDRDSNDEGENLLLRTHVSAMQVKIMKDYEPPFSVVIPGRVFRREATDPRHEHTYDYMEGLAVDENISVANLKYVLKSSMSEFFGAELRTQLRASYFPFVEPGFEVAVECVFCKTKGCRVCGAGWLELLGAGMVHPEVFRHAGYSRDKYTGLAFGFGLSRFAMIKYGIPDIRIFAENDLKFLKQ